jgi:hypothetical protein
MDVDDGLTFTINFIVHRRAAVGESTFVRVNSGSEKPLAPHNAKDYTKYVQIQITVTSGLSYISGIQVYGPDGKTEMGDFTVTNRNETNETGYNFPNMVFIQSNEKPDMDGWKTGIREIDGTVSKWIEPIRGESRGEGDNPIMYTVPPLRHVMPGYPYPPGFVLISGSNPGNSLLYHILFGDKPSRRPDNGYRLFTGKGTTSEGKRRVTMDQTINVYTSSCLNLPAESVGFEHHFKEFMSAFGGVVSTD